MKDKIIEILNKYETPSSNNEFNFIHRWNYSNLAIELKEAISHSCGQLNASLKIGDKVIYSSCVKAEVIEVITNDYIKIKDEYGITFYTNIDVLELDTESV